MHSETNTPAKEDLEVDLSLTVERKSSFLEEDLALSTSTHDSTAERTITEPEEKTHDETTCSESEPQPIKPPAPIYVNEDAMDCNYNDESSNLSNVRQFEELQEDVPSPELFESDADDEAESTTSTFQNVIDNESDPRITSLPSPEKLTTEESILKADKYLATRINKFLRGVPPPPSHTISQKDCDDFLVYIKQNRQYFWADPFLLDGEQTNLEIDTSLLQTSTQDKTNEISSANTSSTSTNSVNSTNSKISHQAKAGLRNLSTAFDACERSSFPKTDNNDSLVADREYSDTTSSFSLSDTLLNSSIFSTSTLTLTNEDSKLGDINDYKKPPTLFSSIKTDEAINMEWPIVFQQRCPDLYFNRNKLCEDFENLRLKLCDRYVGAETQSTCNTWFVKQIPGSARKRNLLAKRNNGQSPSKRLSYLARRRRTFSSANLQGLGLVEKKQLLMNVRKGMIRKGKSPRGKSPRGKSPRGKTPRSSAKKRHLRRLTLDERSPRKPKPEIPKRALFQSPPTDRAGPSRVVNTTITSNNPLKVKRSLFPTPKKNEVNDSSQISALGYPESRKRKSEEELEHSRTKFAKSLSFDCSRNLDSSQTNTWNPMRHSSSGLLTKDQSSNNHGKCELSETHKKKLLWAVAEALRKQGIPMSHPMFKQYATILARTVRKFMPDLENKNIPRKPGSTSDRMLKLAKRHVILIVESKTVT